MPGTRRSRRGDACVAGLAFALAASASPAQDVVAVGDELQINTVTTGGQEAPSLAVGDGSEVLVVWQSDASAGADHDGSSIQAHLHDVNGCGGGPEVQVNSDATGEQLAPVAARNAAGYVVAWTTEIESPSLTSAIVARRLDAAGQPLAADFRVDDEIGGLPRAPAIAARGENGFVVAWSGSAGERRGVGQAAQARRLGASGDPVGGVFTVSGPTGYFATPVALGGADGGFVIASELFGPCSLCCCDIDVAARLFDPDAALIGGELPLDSLRVAGGTFLPRASLAPSGADGFVVAWFGGIDGPGPLIRTQRVSVAGGVEGILDLTSPRGDVQGNPALATMPGGNLLMVREGARDPVDDDGFAIHLRAFVPSVGPLGGTRLVNTITADDQRAPAIAVLADGSAAVAWQSRGSYGDDADSWSVQLRHLVPAIFRGDFETGDATAWAQVVP